MHIEMIDALPMGKDRKAIGAVQAVVRWDAAGTVAELAKTIEEKQLSSLLFVDAEFFSDEESGIELCLRMRTLDINVLWSAVITDDVSRELFREMRLSGCQRLDMRLAPDDAERGLAHAREFGFDVSICNVDGTPYASDRITYDVSEREAIAEGLPGLHSVQFDLAVAYFKARRFSEVMLPLGKAMTLRFPMNELCLNLLACLSAAKHYPTMAAGLLDQAGYGWPHPVVLRNRTLLKSWLESGGDVKGVRLMLDPEGTGASLAYT
ncbi:hypothetical protein [uncultured Pseudodesulfovibrio sp.]|uniref:hypothetical protein n=1 Tax=uncultured Pseudodesulfovibrio sp. TaxID=2035858 RepID=UPI0029C8A606|nr:hypothetical protein [uncultured Pseudodesulfovibrio sp.]